MFFALICGLTVVLLPLAKSFREIAKLIIMPFWKEIIRNTDMGTYHKSFWLVFNVIWFPIWLILSVFYFIVWLLSFVTIVWIPTWIVMLKLAKIMILPIWIKVVTKKEYIQELVKQELKKQWNNSKNENVESSKNESIESLKDENLTIEEKSKLYDEMVNWKDEEKTLNKWDTSVSMEEVLKPFMFLKVVWVMLLFIYQILVWFFIFIEISSILWVIFMFISFIQILLYISIKFNLWKKYLSFMSDNNLKKIISKINIELIFLLISIFIIASINIWLILYLLYSIVTWNFSWEIIGIFISTNISMIHQYIFIKISYKKVWGIDWVIRELDNFQDIKFIKKFKSLVEVNVKPLLVKEES